MKEHQNFIRAKDRIYHERADATLKVSERDIITARYNWAISRFSQRGTRKVLDVGCGLGYGTGLIANSGFEVMGVDKSDSAILTCRHRYSSVAKFFCGSIADLQDNNFDYIVAFEIIEHMDEVAQISFLGDCAQRLAPKGILLLTTPNVKYSKNRNPHHLKEFSYKELKTLFKSAKISGLVLPHLRKALSLIIKPNRIENMHLPIFSVPVSFAEYFLVEVDREILISSLEKIQIS